MPEGEISTRKILRAVRQAQRIPDDVQAEYFARHLVTGLIPLVEQPHESLDVPLIALDSVRLHQRLHPDEIMETVHRGLAVAGDGVVHRLAAKLECRLDDRLAAHLPQLGR